jgi:hypothetical protein
VLAGWHAACSPVRLLSLGVPGGESRYYAEQVHAGQTLLVVDAAGGYRQTCQLLLQYGASDVQSRGQALARAENAGTPEGTGPRPPDITGRWGDVSSRYEMLWGQHYGSTDQTWPQMAPIYRWAWEAANDPQHRGQSWSQVEARLRQAWPGPQPWSDVREPIEDVWTDVADEATTGAEGGQDRRIPRQGSDQQVAARTLLPPSEPIQ